MANFFGKAKPHNQASPTKDANQAAGPSSIENDFQKTFKPFVLKKDAQLAPHNWFLERQKRKPESGATHDDAIVIDEDINSKHEVPEARTKTLSPNGLARGDVSSEFDYVWPRNAICSTPEGLREVLPLLRQQCLMRTERRKVPSFKTYNDRAVRDIVGQLNEAEIAGDPVHVRQLLKELSDRNLFPAKVLIFKDDARPGYYGTWTRNSRIIGPRTPFAQDLLARDYAYDSGEEWEDEDAGQADDVMDDADDDDGDGEEPDSDLDSWLVDDEEMDTSLPPDPRDLSPSSIDLPISPLKRKADGAGRQLEKKRKVVVPLAPFAKGPCWESIVGQCDYEPFEPYRIQLFNGKTSALLAFARFDFIILLDIPFPIDPFTFISVAAEERQNTKAELVLPDKPVVARSAVTALPGKRPGVAQTPKRPFPEEHLSTLFAKITELATPNFTYLVESIYQELRVHKVKKNSIEAKAREVCEKSKDKVWVVKEAIRVSSNYYFRCIIFIITFQALHGLS